MSDVFDTGIAPHELDADRPQPIETPWGSFSLFVVADPRGVAVRCVQSFCPHLQGPLFQGTISGETITCPWHQWRFSLRTGRRIDVLGRVMRERNRLATCDVSLSTRGTLQLAFPRRT